MKKMVCLVIGLSLLAASFCLSSSAADTTAPSKWDGSIPEVNLSYAFDGKGTKAEPWLIQSATDLAQLASNVRLDSRDTTYGGKYFKLTCDIDLDNHPWLGIGGGKIAENDGLGTDGKTGINYFAGNFDGDWHKIYNLKLATTGTVKNAETGAEETHPVHQQGLFGYILGARISNLGIESGEIVLDGNNRCGALVGVGRCGFLIENCYNKANVTVTSAYKGVYVGAFSGQLIDKWDINANTEKKTSGVYKEKKIMNCYNLGNLNVTLNQTDGANEFRVGGIAAQYVGGAPELNRVYNIGDVNVVSNSVASSKTNHCVGGITGAFLDSAFVVDTYFKGKITFKATVANGENDLKKYRVGFLFGRCSGSVTFDSEEGVNVGFEAKEGSDATLGVGEWTEAKAWYQSMQDITLPLAANSEFMIAADVPEPQPPVSSEESTSETPTKPGQSEKPETPTGSSEPTGTNKPADSENSAETTGASVNTKKDGCSSSIGAASIALIGLAVLGGLFAGKKKKEH